MVVATFNQEKALVEALSVIIQYTTSNFAKVHLKLSSVVKITLVKMTSGTRHLARTQLNETPAI